VISNTSQHTAALGTSLQHHITTTTSHYNTLHCNTWHITTTSHYNNNITLQHIALQHFAHHYNITLQHIATPHSNTLELQRLQQRTATTHCNTTCRND